jgi:hypothetical protein
MWLSAAERTFDQLTPAALDRRSRSSALRLCSPARTRTRRLTTQLYSIHYSRPNTRLDRPRCYTPPLPLIHAFPRPSQQHVIRERRLDGAPAVAAGPARAAAPGDGQRARVGRVQPQPARARRRVLGHRRLARPRVRRRPARVRRRPPGHRPGQGGGLRELPLAAQVPRPQGDDADAAQVRCGCLPP